jgi:hypothetical protein
MSHASSELIPVPNKPTADKVDAPNAAPASDEPSTPTLATATASTPTAVAPVPVPARNPVAIQRLFKFPTSVGLSYNDFEVSFSTNSIEWEWPNYPLRVTDSNSDANVDRRVFEIMPAPADAALHRYVKDLAPVRMEISAMPEGDKHADEAVTTLELHVKAEEELAMSLKRVCEAAGGLRIADPSFSPRE